MGDEGINHVSNEMRGRDHEEIDLRDAFALIVSRWKLIAIFTMTLTVFTLIVSFLLPPVYRSTAVILPINEPITPLFESGGLSMLAGLIGIGGNSSSTIKVILKSNSIKENIINKHDLMKVLFEDEWDNKNEKWKDETPNIWEGIRELDDLVKIEEDRKTGALSISADFRDPQIAADISRWFIEELSTTLKKKSFSMARHQRENIEEIIGSLAGHLKAPEGDIPEFSAFMRKMRDLEISQRAYEELMVQYYLAKFKEAKEDVVFQIIDEPKPPDKKARPLILVNLAVSLVVSLLFGIFYVVISDRKKLIHNHS